MRIKRIEVLGFKSFCDRAVLNFGEPIVGVVGPNGCGKSNIVDAIRWCMGEQSAKNLRGQAMGDVIFAGSDSRGPAGMAEVSLTFEDVGFSHETLQSALDSEESLNDPLLESASDTNREVDSDKAAVARLAAIAAQENTSEPTEVSAQEDAPQNSNSAESTEDNASPEEEDEEIDPYQATKEAAALLADKPPIIDYAKYSEVTITRRLFRDGTSSYFLNKTPCRLRDITDFFLGSGVGTKAYSIIEQGRIGMIVSARAGDRRHIIEEAAGITKFKTKKRAAERKLDQTRQNLLRISDIVAELAKRLGSLRRQAQKAERYRRYKDEVKDIELWMAGHRFLELKGLELTLASDIESISASLHSARAELESKDASVMAERADLGIEERRLNALQEQIFELENHIGLSQNKVEFQTREAAELNTRCRSAAEEIDRLEIQLAAEREDLSVQREEFGEIDAVVEVSKQNAAEREVRFLAAKSTFSTLQTALQEARAQVAQARADIARSQTTQESLAARTKDANARLALVMDETQGMDARVAEREKTAKGLRESLAVLLQTRLDLGNKSEEFAVRRAELEEKVSHCEAEVETLRSEVHRRKSRLHSLREIHEKYEGFARGTKAVMQNSEQLAANSTDFEIRGLVADVVSAPERLEIAVEAALGDRLGGILVNRAEAGAKAIEYLKETSAGRSAFVPFRVPKNTPLNNGDRSKQSENGSEIANESGQGVIGNLIDLVSFESDYRDVGANLLQDILVVESLNDALALRNPGVSQTLVTLDGDIIDSRGVVAGGSRDSQGASILAQKREIRELDEMVEELERDLASATGNLVGTKNELVKVTKALDALRNERHDGELAMTANEKDLAGAESELKGLRERLSRLNHEQIELDDRVGALAHESLIMRELHQTATVAMEEHEKIQLGLIEQVTTGQEEVDSLSTEVTEAKIRVAQIGEKRASLESSILRLEKSEEVLSNRMEKLRTDIANDSDRSEHLTRESEELSTELIAKIAEQTTLAAQLDSGRGQYEQRNSDIQIAEVEVRTIRSQSESLAKDLADRDAKLSTMNSDMRHLIEGIEERYHLELSKIVHEYHLRPVVSPEDEERLHQRRKLIERMGSDINLTAIEEFQTLSERHDFLSTQQVDLESAVRQLDDAIQKINKTSRRLFRETFDLINNKFIELFPKLFRGGRARLQLTGGADVDVLEAGVEIHAQPPGKKNTTVDQLSGGEKALTAVALLFSIFLIKPSPFCLLDEVDAPLDEANVDRYNEILRSMTDHSQFIVITHNKRTMSVADRLYGVTMQEPGVSKLVTVNLQKIGEKVKAA